MNDVFGVKVARKRGIGMNYPVNIREWAEQIHTETFNLVDGRCTWWADIQREVQIANVLRIL